MLTVRPVCDQVCHSPPAMDGGRGGPRHRDHSTGPDASHDTSDTRSSQPRPYQRTHAHHFLVIPFDFLPLHPSTARLPHGLDVEEPNRVAWKPQCEGTPVPQHLDRSHDTCVDDGLSARWHPHLSDWTIALRGAVWSCRSPHGATQARSGRRHPGCCRRRGRSEEASGRHGHAL